MVTQVLGRVVVSRSSAVRRNFHLNFPFLGETVKPFFYPGPPFRQLGPFSRLIDLPEGLQQLAQTLRANRQISFFGFTNHGIRVEVVNPQDWGVVELKVLAALRKSMGWAILEREGHTAIQEREISSANFRR